MSYSRRSLVKGAAWAAPAVAATALVPAYASSAKDSGGNNGDTTDNTPVVPDNGTTCAAGQWKTGAQIRYTDIDYSNINYLNKVNYNTTPDGEAMLQHWFNANTGKVYWRLVLGFPEGAASGAKITFAPNTSWTNPSSVSQRGVNTFKALDAKKPELYTQDLPTAVAFRDGENFGVSFPNGIPAGSAGVFEFNADPVGGSEAVKAGTVYEAWATVDFAPASC